MMLHGDGTHLSSGIAVGVLMTLLVVAALGYYVFR
jgi:hypothetical protein